MRVVVERVAIIIVIVIIPHIAITNHLIADTSPHAVVVPRVVVTTLKLTQNITKAITQAITTAITVAIHTTLTADTTTTATRTREVADATGDIAPTEIMSEFICTLLV
jgi:hypothetical protein